MDCPRLWKCVLNRDWIIMDEHIGFASIWLFSYFMPECFPTLCTIDASHILKCLTVVFRVKETRQGILSSKESPTIYNIHLAVKTEKGCLTNIWISHCSCRLIVWGLCFTFTFKHTYCIYCLYKDFLIVVLNDVYTIFLPLWKVTFYTVKIN